jgi:phosphatidylserine/phosphatidylglycerophosphate/cardiolipin synthase-like enzyme
MIERPSILVPYETFTVNVRFAPSDTLTPLEQLVIRAVHAGAHGIAELDTIFGIGKRPMLRLILDLLNHAFITVNFKAGEIRLTPQIVKAVENNELEKLGGLERVNETVTLMRDRVAGTISRLRPRQQIQGGQRIPNVLEAATAPDPAQVLQAVRGRLSQRTSRSGRPMHPIEVAMNLEREPDDGAQRYLALEVRPEYDAAADYLRINIEQPADLPWEARNRLEQKLTELANVDQPEIVFKNLRDKALKPEDNSPQAQLDRLQSIVEELETAIPGTYADWQQRLERAAVEVDGMLGLQSAGILEGTVIVGDAQHVAAIKQMLASAAEQVVIACPFVRYDAMELYRADVAAALQNGKKVFFLFGIGDTFELDVGVSAWMSRLKERHPHHLFFSRSSARCHAKFVVADAADALLTSYNFLDRQPAAVLEVGVRITARATEGEGAQHRGVCRMATDILKIAREIYPEYADAQRLIDSVALFGGAGAALPAAAEMPALPESGERESAELQEHRTVLWKLEWRRHMVRLRERAETLPTTYSHVRDVAHRKLLFDAIRSAQHRLCIVSDQLSSGVLNLNFREEMVQCVNRGTEVLLVYRRPQAGAQEILRSLAAVCGDRLRHIAANGSERAGESHAKLLICDDWAVVTSFNFLSFPGEYEGAEKHRVRTELGVLIRGSGAVRDLCAMIGNAIPPLAEFLEELARPLAASRIVDMTAHRDEGRPRRLDELFAQLAKLRSERPANQESGRRDVGGIIGNWFATAPDPRIAVAELQDLAAVDAPFLDQAIAACLAVRRDLDDEQRRTWTTRLIAEIWWKCGDPYAVASLLESEQTANDDPAVPPKAVAVLAANCHVGCATTADFEDTALDCDDGPGATAVASLAIPAVLYDEKPPTEILGYVKSSLSPALQEWASQALAFRTGYPRGLSGIDIASLHSREALAEGAEEARQELSRLLQSALTMTFNFKLGAWAWTYLINAPVGLKRLAEALQKSDVDTARSFLKEYGKKEACDVLDDAVENCEKGFFEARPIIEGRYRRALIADIAKIVGQTRTWVSEVTKLTDAERIPSESIMVLARGIAAHAGDVAALASELQNSRAYTYPLVVTLQERMQPFVRLVTE